MRIGCCITPHGFGHGARAAAVLEALADQPGDEIILVTGVPEWFFRDSLTREFSYQELRTDVGLVQKDSLQEDLPATVTALDGFYPIDDRLLARAEELFSGCDLILCDIAPLGILAAKRLGIASVLMENFTWDWIYTQYVKDFPGLRMHIDYLGKIYAQADFHLQTRPFCRLVAGAPRVEPVSRARRTSRREIRRLLGIDDERPLVLLTMGGIPGTDYGLEPLAEKRDCLFLLGGCTRRDGLADNIRCLPPETELYHPDLVAAADAVIGKIGYSTLAEVYNSGVPFGYVPRQNFPESPVLAEFISREMNGLAIAPAELQSGRWVDRLEQLFDLGPFPVIPENGAVTAAGLIRLFYEQGAGSSSA